MTKSEVKKKHRSLFFGPLLGPLDYINLFRFLAKNRLSEPKSSGVIGEFETRFSEYMQGGECLLTQSGTAGILSAMAALGLKAGDEVILPSFGFHACIMPARFLGLKVKWAPVAEKTFLLDVNKLESFVSEKTKAVYVLHLFGQSVDPKPIEKLQKRWGFKTIADSSHAFMARSYDRPVGSYEDIAVFSLQQNKFLACGEGGVVWSKNPSLIDRIKRLAHPGQNLLDPNSPFRDLSFGLKFRPHPFVGWLANNQFQKRHSIFEAHNQAADAVKHRLLEIHPEIDLLPVSTSNSQPAGYCYVKFRLPPIVTDNQVQLFRQSVKENGHLLKAEHFKLMSELPTQAPFGFGFHKVTEVSDPTVFQEELKPLIQKQFGIRLPTKWKDEYLEKFYSNDLKLISNFIKRGRCQ